MRKDPEKKQAGKERRKKRLAAIISICLSIAVVITAIAGTIAYTMTNQLPQDEKQFSEKERKVLLQTFQTVTSEKKQPLRRVIDSQNPLNLVNYYGDEPLLTLWNSIPENQQPYTVLLLIPGHTLTRQRSGARMARNDRRRMRKKSDSICHPEYQWGISDGGAHSNCLAGGALCQPARLFLRSQCRRALQRRHLAR